MCNIYNIILFFLLFIYHNEIILNKLIKCGNISIRLSSKNLKFSQIRDFIVNKQYVIHKELQQQYTIHKELFTA